tara:strand:+ start:198 stop:386 length:189 start_codon:yes stop_codon:yes gene_type:complete
MLKEKEIYTELKAETIEGTFSIGYFYNLEDAKKAMLSDKNSENPVISVFGEVEYIWDEEIIG